MQALKTPFQLCSWKKQSQHTKITTNHVTKLSKFSNWYLQTADSQGATIVQISILHTGIFINLGHTTEWKLKKTAARAKELILLQKAILADWQIDI